MMMFCLWTRVFLDFLGLVSNQGKDDLGRDLMLHRRRLDDNGHDRVIVVPYPVLEWRLEA